LELCLQQVRQFVSDHPSPDKTQAVQALDKLERSDVPVTSLAGAKEVEVLQAVWNRIHHPSNETRRDDLKESLFQQLISCVENGSTVCTNGRVSRLVDSLNVVDPLVTLKPRWAVRREMLDKVAQLRQQSPTMADDEFKDHVRLQLTQEYVDSNLLTGAVLDAELKEWLDHVV
jgi:hypothetical protein